MRRMWWLLGLVAAALLLAAAVAPSFAMEERKVTVDLRDAPADEALRVVFRDTPFSFTFSPEVDRQRRVTVTLNDVPFAVALRAIGSAANLEITAEPDNPWVYVVKSRPMITTMGGAQIPVVGAVAIGPGGGGTGRGGGGFGGGMGGGGGGGFSGVFPGPIDTAALLGSLDRAHPLIVPPAGPGEKLVDLDVKDVPIREAMAQLSKASSMEIAVHPAVSPQIKVTARAFAVPAEWLLNTIASQSRLTVVAEAISEQPSPPPSEAVTLRLLHPRYRYHLVPPPEIQVSGVPGPPASAGTGAGPIVLPDRMVPRFRRSDGIAPLAEDDLQVEVAPAR